MRPKLILACPIQNEAIAHDGTQLPGGRVSMPRGAKILHLGVAYPTELIALFVWCDPPPLDKTTGQPRPYRPDELQTLHFVVATAGQLVPENFTFRGPVRSKDTVGNEAIVFVFERPASQLIIAEG